MKDLLSLDPPIGSRRVAEVAAGAAGGRSGDLVELEEPARLAVAAPMAPGRGAGPDRGMAPPRGRRRSIVGDPEQGQVWSATARRRSSAVAKAPAQGQRRGMCSRDRRPERLMRPGTLRRRARRVFATTAPRAPSPRRATQRTRLWARAAISAQAALAKKRPEGQWAKALGLQVADRQLDHGVGAVVGVERGRRAGAVGEKGVVAPVGKELRPGRPQGGCGARSGACPGRSSRPPRPGRRRV